MNPTQTQFHLNRVEIRKQFPVSDPERGAENGGGDQRLSGGMTPLMTATALGLIGFSLAVLVIFAVFEGGRSATPYGTKDQNGFEVGFNNRMTPDHYAIMFRNATPGNVLRELGYYQGSCLLAQLLGLGLIIRTRRQGRSPLRDAYFFTQMLIFPLGWLGALFSPFFFYDVYHGRVDGETFTDGPPIVCIPQGTWVLTALAVFLLSRIARTTSMEPAEASR